MDLHHDQIQLLFVFFRGRIHLSSSEEEFTAVSPEWTFISEAVLKPDSSSTGVPESTPCLSC